jgi:hypothetical protein
VSTLPAEPSPQEQLACLHPAATLGRSFTASTLIYCHAQDDWDILQLTDLAWSDGTGEHTTKLRTEYRVQPTGALVRNRQVAGDAMESSRKWCADGRWQHPPPELLIELRGRLGIP